MMRRSAVVNGYPLRSDRATYQRMIDGQIVRKRSAPGLSNHSRCRPERDWKRRRPLIQRLRAIAVQRVRAGIDPKIIADFDEKTVWRVQDRLSQKLKRRARFRLVQQPSQRDAGIHDYRPIKCRLDSTVATCLP